MSSVVISGDTSGTVTVTVPAVAGTNTATLPAATGTVALTSDVIGISQTWQNLTASRAVNTTYTNSTGKPIMVIVTGTGTGTVAVLQATVGGVVVAACTTTDYYSAIAATPMQQTLNFIVPNSTTYTITGQSGSPSVQSWAELR